MEDYSIPLDTEKRYALKAKVCVKDVSYEDEQSDGVKRNETEKMVFLSLLPSSENDRFLDAWLPSFEQLADPCREFEVVFQAAHPINGYFKGRVCYPDSNCDKHHIFVLTVSAEHDLLALDTKEFVFESLAEQESHLGDLARNFESPGKKKYND